MSKPTPRPWYIVEQSNKRGLETLRICFEDTTIGKVLNWNLVDGHTQDLPGKANAAHIVQCVNMHDEFVNLLHQLVENFAASECCCDGAPDAMFACFFHRNERKIKQLLAEAK